MTKRKISLFKALFSIEAWLISIRHRLTHYKARIYVAGQITGLDEFEYTGNFNYCSSVVKRLGFIAVNPLTLPKRKTWIGYMVQDVFELLLCRNAYFMDNWPESKGAKIEHFVAVITFKNIIYEQSNYKTK